MNLEHIVRKPTGPAKPTPVLFLHGAWHGAWCYELWLDDFAVHGYEAHAMSLPGHGKSPRTKPINLYGVDDYTRALEHIVDQIAPKPFVVAHSMGGAVLQELLKYRRDLPGAVLLASVPIFGALPFFLRYARSYPLTYAWAMMTLDFRRMLGTPELVERFLVSQDAAYTAEHLCAHLCKESLRIGLELALTWRGDPRRVHTPLLVVAAEKDAIFLIHEARQTADAYGAELLLIPDQGHNLMIERDWRHTAARLRAWIERIERRREDQA
jgi:pimeloyl-ACP methyl ester carboxylesterase